MALEANALIDRTYLAQMWRAIVTDDEDFADELINQASAIAERISGRKLKAREHTDVYDGNGRTTLMLREYPIVSVSSLYIDPLREWGAATEIAAADYYVNAAPAILHYAGGFGTTEQSVRVVYTAGFETVPSDLKESTLEVVAWLWTRQRGNNIALRTEQGIDGTRTEHELTIPMSARRTFEDYRGAA